MAVDVKKLIADAQSQAEEAKAFKSREFKANDLKDGESVDIKLVFPKDSEISVQALLIEMGKDKTFRSYFSQNFPFDEDNLESCALLSRIAQVEANPISKSKYAPLLANVSKKKYFYMPCLVLSIQYDAAYNVESYKVKDNEVKFLRLTPNQSATLLSKISLPAAQNAGIGVYDPLLGKVITVSRTGAGKMDTKYGFDLGKEVAIKEDIFYGESADNSAVDYIKSQILSEEKLIEAFTTYFIG